MAVGKTGGESKPAPERTDFLSCETRTKSSVETCEGYREGRVMMSLPSMQKLYHHPPYLRFCLPWFQVPVVAREADNLPSDI